MSSNRIVDSVHCACSKFKTMRWLQLLILYVHGFVSCLNAFVFFFVCLFIIIIIIILPYRNFEILVFWKDARQCHLQLQAMPCGMILSKFLSCSSNNYQFCGGLSLKKINLSQSQVADSAKTVDRLTLSRISAERYLTSTNISKVLSNFYFVYLTSLYGRGSKIW